MVELYEGGPGHISNVGLPYTPGTDLLVAVSYHILYPFMGQFPLVIFFNQRLTHAELPVREEARVAHLSIRRPNDRPDRI